jgi:NADPH2:quinone reductase
MRVIATAGTPAGRDLVFSQGAHHVVDHRAADHFDQVLELTGGSGIDVIVEMLANINLGRDLKILGQGGRVVVIGSRGLVEIDPRDTMIRDASILGILLFNASEQELTTIHAAVASGLESGTLSPVVGREMPLAEAAEAHRAIMDGPAYGKIVLVP